MTILQVHNLPDNKSADTEKLDRKDRAQKIINESKQFLSTNILTNELNEHINALKDQKMKLTNHQAIVILLDYAERELVAIENISKEKPTSLFQRILKLFK